MFKQIFEAMKFAAGRLIRDWKLVLLLVAVFAVMLTGIWVFANAGVGSIAKLIVGSIGVIISVGAFFFLQALTSNYTSRSKSFGELLKTGTELTWRIVLVSIPIIALAYFISDLAQRAEVAIVPISDGIGYIDESRSNTTWFSDWRILLVGTMRAILFYLVLPMMAIQFWITVAQHGIGGMLRRFFSVLRRSFSAKNLIAFLFGAIVFALIPYFLLKTRTPLSKPSFELIAFGARVLLSSLLILFGWTTTIGALSRLNADALPEDPLASEAGAKPTEFATTS